MSESTVERIQPRVGARIFPFGLSWGETAALFAGNVVLAFTMLFRTDPVSLLAGLCVIVVYSGAFLVRVNRQGERFIHVGPRWAGLGARVTAGEIDVHFREVEGRHYTHRPPTADFPLSRHIGAHLWLSSFSWRERNIALLVDGGTRLRPWRASYVVTVQVSGRGQLVLESDDFQDAMLRRWTGFLNTTAKSDLGLTGVQELLLSRPVIEGEGAHWTSFEELLTDQPPARADYYRKVQLIHDTTATDRRMFVAFRTGGTFMSWVNARHTGSSRAGVEEHWRKVLAKLGPAVQQAGLDLVRVLDFDQANALFRLLVDPGYAPALGHRDTGRAVPTVPTQVAHVSHWDDRHISHLSVNGHVAITYTVVGLPHKVIGPHFIASALLKYAGLLRVSVTMVPENAKASHYVNRAGMTNAAERRSRRASSGTVTTESERLEDVQPEQRDVEIAHGHHPLMADIYLTVFGEDLRAAQRAGDDLATHLDVIGVEIAVCHAWQGAAYRNTLPLVRGV